MTILEKATAIIGVSASRNASLLSALVEMCTDEAIAYCNLAEYTTDLDNVVVQMVVERYNRRGYEGAESVSASDITNKFYNGYSKSTLSMLNKYRKVKTV